LLGKNGGGLRVLGGKGKAVALKQPYKLQTDMSGIRGLAGCESVAIRSHTCAPAEERRKPGESQTSQCQVPAAADGPPSTFLQVASISQAATPLIKTNVRSTITENPRKAKKNSEHICTGKKVY